MLHFSSYRLLKPSGAIESDQDEIYREFVSAFPLSTSRFDLFHEWSKYNKLLRREIGQGFVQWIDGSFISQKSNPKDIDIVSLIPASLYEKHQLVLDNFWSDKWEREGIDAYFVKIYPEHDPNFLNFTYIDLRQWEKRYSWTKPDANFVQHQKGFLTVTIL